jgi:hypothetical protein
MFGSLQIYGPHKTAERCFVRHLYQHPARQPPPGHNFYYYTIKDIKMQFEPGSKKSWVCDVFCRPVPPFLCNSEKERKI